MEGTLNNILYKNKERIGIVSNSFLDIRGNPKIIPFESVYVNKIKRRITWQTNFQSM